MDEVLITLLLSHHHVDWHAWGHEAARHRHWQVCTQTYTLAGAGCTKGCQSFLLCCFSLTCLIQSKTVSKSDRRRKKKKTRRRERLSPSFHRYDSVQAAASKLKLPFTLDNIVSSLLKCPRAIFPHTDVSHTHMCRWEKCSDRSTSSLGSVHSTVSAHHLQKRTPACSKKTFKGKYYCWKAAFPAMWSGHFVKCQSLMKERQNAFPSLHKPMAYFFAFERCVTLLKVKGKIF